MAFLETPGSRADSVAQLRAVPNSPRGRSSHRYVDHTGIRPERGSLPPDFPPPREGRRRYRPESLTLHRNCEAFCPPGSRVPDHPRPTPTRPNSSQRIRLTENHRPARAQFTPPPPPRRTEIRPSHRDDSTLTYRRDRFRHRSHSAVGRTVPPEWPDCAQGQHAGAGLQRQPRRPRPRDLALRMAGDQRVGATRRPATRAPGHQHAHR